MIRKWCDAVDMTDTILVRGERGAELAFQDFLKRLVGGTGVIAVVVGSNGDGSTLLVVTDAVGNRTQWTVDRDNVFPVVAE